LNSNTYYICLCVFHPHQTRIFISFIHCRSILILFFIYLFCLLTYFFSLYFLIHRFSKSIYVCSLSSNSSNTIKEYNQNTIILSSIFLFYIIFIYSIRFRYLYSLVHVCVYVFFRKILLLFYLYFIMMIVFDVLTLLIDRRRRRQIKTRVLLLLLLLLLKRSIEKIVEGSRRLIIARPSRRGRPTSRRQIKAGNKKMRERERERERKLEPNVTVRLE